MLLIRFVLPNLKLNPRFCKRKTQHIVYIEEFVIYLYDTFNNTFAFRGTAHGEVTEYKSVNDKDNLKKLQKKVEKYKLDNISVKQGVK